MTPTPTPNPTPNPTQARARTQSAHDARTIGAAAPLSTTLEQPSTVDALPPPEPLSSGDTQQAERASKTTRKSPP